MRIIWLAAALIGAAAAGGTAAQAEGRGGGWHGPRHPGAGGAAFDVLRPARHGFGRGPGRRHRREARFDSPAFLYPYGGGGIGGFESVDPHGNGFFAGGGGQVEVAGGRAHYDYDRSYPYEWASAAGGGRGPWAAEEKASPSLPSCEVERGVRVCRGGR